jgi:hypothetical protein
LKKRTKKLLLLRRSNARVFWAKRGRGPSEGRRVFCFFFAKKKTFLSWFENIYPERKRKWLQRKYASAAMHVSGCCVASIFWLTLSR